MSLFGSSPPKEEALPRNDSFARSRHNLFDGDTNQSSASLFDDDDDLTGTGGTSSPWDMPTPRKQQSRADLLRSLLSNADVPDSYVDVFDSVLREEDSSSGQIGPKGLMRTLSAAKLSADQSSRIMSIVSPGGGEPQLGRSEFNVFLALIGLAQEKETLSLDGVDERRRSEYNYLPMFSLRIWLRIQYFPPILLFALVPEVVILSSSDATGHFGYLG